MTGIDVVAIGELLIDFTPVGKSENGYPLFEMNPGGAPVNCLAMLTRLGARTEFVGKVGEDSFGKFLRQILTDLGVGVSNLSVTDKFSTTLAFVHLNDNGERNFSFLRNPGADTQLEKREISLSLIDRTKILHFGSLSLTDEPSRSTTMYAVKYAREKGKIISFDPNYRPLLWDDKAEAVYWMRKGLEYADIVKMSDEELGLITGESNILAGVRAIAKQGVTKIFITMGSKGAYYCCNGEKGYVNGFTVSAVDTTGCGDSFTGAILYQLLFKKEKPINKMVEFANAAGALCATKRGGLPAIPEKAEFEKLISSI